MTPIGLDGCKGGWLAVAGRPPAVSATLYERLEDVPAGMLVIDTPIGLPDDWSTPRPTDRAARKLLSLLNWDGHKGVGSRVFPAPPRLALEMWRSGASQAEINAASTDKKISAQAFNILDKIAGADAVVTPARQEHMREGHPEIAFADYAGHTLAPKKSVKGVAERRALLAAHAFDIDALATSLGKKTRRWAFDDLLDACVLNTVAQRCIRGSGKRLPAAPIYDSTGRDMAIWY